MRDAASEVAIEAGRELHYGLFEGLRRILGTNRARTAQQHDARPGR